MSNRQIFYYKVKWSQPAPNAYITSTLADHIEHMLETHDMAAAKEVIVKIKQNNKL